MDAPPAPRPPAKKVARPVEAIERVLILSIDGLWPDLALRAYMPRLRALCASASYTFWAETAAEAYTLPCHVSMLTGVSSDKHGVTWNEYMEEAYPNSPTLFELAHEVGYSTALVTGKMKFITLLKPLSSRERPGEGSVPRVQGSGFRVQDDNGEDSVGNALRGVPQNGDATEADEIQNPQPPTPNPQP
ncbi:MAG: hypothetical protein B7Z73_05580, partial [Planctomycetia bacterium 21-64-5]